MAGIGFKLIRLLDKQSYTGVMQAYGYAALIGSGPWVLSMMTLGCLGIALRATQTGAALDTFFVSVTYVFAASLVATGPLQLVISRYAADRIFAREKAKIFPSYLGALILVMGVGALLGIGFFVGAVPGPITFRLAGVGLLMAVSGVWVSTVFLSAVKDYPAVLKCFAGGYALSFVTTWLGSSIGGLGGMALGFLIGQTGLLLSLVWVIFHEFGVRTGPSFEFLNYFKRHRVLAACGLIYNLGIWIDKPVHWWFSSHGFQVAGALWAAPLYDEAVYLSFLSVAPGMAIFLLSVETTFALHYERFFRQVVDKASLKEIRKTKQLMIEALRDGMSRMLKFQGIVTVLLVIEADTLLGSLGLGAVQPLVFRVTLVGVFLLVILLALLTVLFYLDRIKEALWACCLFAATNLLGTLAGMALDERWYGMGFTMGAAVGVVYAMGQTNYWLNRIDYETFTAQPVYDR